MKRLLAALRPHTCFIVLLLSTQLLLGWRIATTGQWSAWINGDVQSVLTLRYWSRDGFFKPHAFLLITQGYTPFIRLFDGTDLDDHALSSWYVKDGHLVRRIYYNHFPNFNLVPMALVAAVAGSEHLFLFQAVQMAQSAIGVAFLYAFLYLLFRSRIAAGIAAGSYLFSDLYVDWAHATNIAVDDFFKYQLLFFSVLEKTAERNARRLVTAAMWLAYFLMCLTTLESIVFGYVWIVGYDLIEKRRIRWKRWFGFGMAAVLARAVQALQSLAAFGWDDMMADWFGRWNTMANQDGKASILEHFLSVSREVRYLIGFGWDKHRIIELHLLVIVFVAFTGFGLLLLARHERARVGSWWNAKALIPALLFVAGCAFGFIFPGASWMRYEGRQFMPFFASLIAYLIVEWPALKGTSLKKWAVIFIAVPIVGVLGRQMYLSTVTLLRGTPTYSFGKYEPAYFRLGAEINRRTDNRTSMVFLLEQHADLIPFIPNPQFPTREVYSLDAQLLYAADAHIMVFKNPDRLAEQLQTIEERTDGQMKPYIVADSNDGLNAVRDSLSARGFSPIREQPDVLIDTQPWLGMEFGRK